jgi:hypothetical protein
MARLPFAAQGSRSRAADEEEAARDHAPPGSVAHLDSADAEQLLDSVGFLLVPGAPLDRSPAYLLVAVRPQPTLSHFDPERVVLWASGTKGPAQTVLEWPLVPPEPHYAWGTIEVIDRLGAVNRFASFGGDVSVAKDGDLGAVLFRSDAPIFAAGGHSGAADPLGADAAAFFGVLRATAGNEPRVGDLIHGCSPIALYAAFLERRIAVCEGAQIEGLGTPRLASLLRQERCRLQRENVADQLQGERLAALIRQIASKATEEVHDGRTR